MMTSAKFLAVPAGLPVAHAASAQEAKIASARMTCAEFTRVDEAYQPAPVYWVAGVDRLGVKETDSMVVDTAHPVAAAVADACRKDPATRFRTKVRAIIKAS
ncbi:acid stress chaperone HdeA [Paraburkholderia strydomiana]|nr:acid stress chaperone HdeA [Paraburkholderia strydomiana]